MFIKKSFLLPFFLLFLFLYLPFRAVSQDKNAENPIILSQKNVQRIAIDPLGNLYLISESSLFKYDLTGKQLASYSNFQYGSIQDATVNNPLKIMLFYRETGKLVFLDDRLSPIGSEFDLFSSNYYNITLATYSLNNQIWLYDQSNSTLEICDIFFHPINRITYHFDDFQPIQLTEIQGRNFLMTNPDQAIYLFDSFGTLTKTLPLKTEHPVQANANSIFYIKENKIERYNYVELKLETMDFPCNSLVQILLYNNTIISLDAAGVVRIYPVMN